ncbi:hypothetical protein QJQ45_028324, partial [Haematococcus lacustris]
MAQHHERLAAQMTALQSVFQTAISEDWQHHVCASGATRLENPHLKPLQLIQVECISMQDRNQSSSPNPHSPAGLAARPTPKRAFLEALDAAHYPLALYPPQQIRTDSFSQAFFDYLRAIDRLLSMPSLLQQRSELQAQLPRGAFSDCPICALVPGVPQDVYVHCVAGDACNKPSSYAGEAKAPRDLEQHIDTYLDRSWLLGICICICSGQSYNRGNMSWSRRSGSSSKIGRRGQQKHHGSAEGESPLIARDLVILVEGQVS